MYVPNSSSLGGIKVAEHFGVEWWVGEHMATMSNSNASCFRVELSYRWLLTINLCNLQHKSNLIIQPAT